MPAVRAKSGSSRKEEGKHGSKKRFQKIVAITTLVIAALFAVTATRPQSVQVWKLPTAASSQLVLPLHQSLQDPRLQLNHESVEEAKDHEKGERGHESEAEGEKEEKIKEWWAFTFVTIIIIFSVSFESGVEYVRHGVPEELQEVIAALLEELTTLGFLGFAFFLTTVEINDQPSLIESLSLYSLGEREALAELFEGLHYLVFTISLSYIFCTLGGMYDFQYGEGGSVSWGRYDEAGKQTSGAAEYIALLQVDCDNPSGSIWVEWSKTDKQMQAEYLRLRARFIDENKEPELSFDFDFRQYLQRRTAEVFSSLVGISLYDWLATWLFLLAVWLVLAGGDAGQTHTNVLLYLLVLVLIFSFTVCLLAKLVWIKAQLLPRLNPTAAAARAESAARAAEAVRGLLSAGLYYSQRLAPRGAVEWQGAVRRAASKAAEELFGRATEGGTRQERLFWLGPAGPAAMLHMLRLAMLWTIISLALLLSHSVGAMSALGPDQRALGWLVLAVVAVVHILAIRLVYAAARTYALCVSVGGLRDAELVEAIHREQRLAKCAQATDMLRTLHYYLEQTRSIRRLLEGDPDGGGGGGGGGATARSVGSGRFVPETAEEERAAEELREVFDAFDAGGGGELSFERTRELLLSLDGQTFREGEMDRLLKLMDRDGSGSISFDELAAVMLTKKQRIKHIPLSEVAEQLFEMFDKDGTGSISMDEVTSTLSKMGQNWDMGDVVDFFELVDADKSGEVDRDEFFAFIQEVESVSAVDN